MSELSENEIDWMTLVAQLDEANDTATRLRGLLRELVDWTSDTIPNELEERLEKELVDEEVSA